MAAATRDHIVAMLDLIQAKGEAGMEALRDEDGIRLALLLLDVRDLAVDEQRWLRSLPASLHPETVGVLTRYRLSLAQVEAFSDRMMEPYPETDLEMARRAGDAHRRLLDLRVDVLGLQE